jgi:hypothetical protein
MPQVSINGKTYENPDDVPPEAREAYQKALEILHDEDHNGVPDFLEGKPLKGITDMQSTLILPGKQQIIFDGKSYASADELPPAARLKYDQAVAKLGPLLSDTNGNGIPDMLEGKLPGAEKVVSSDTQPTTLDMPSIKPQEPPPSVISDATPNYGAIGMIMIAALVLVGLLGLGVYLVLPLIK